MSSITPLQKVRGTPVSLAEVGAAVPSKARLRRRVSRNLSPARRLSEVSWRAVEELREEVHLAEREVIAADTAARQVISSDYRLSKLVQEALSVPEKTPASPFIARAADARRRLASLRDALAESHEAHTGLLESEGEQTPRKRSLRESSLSQRTPKRRSKVNPA